MSDDHTDYTGHVEPGGPTISRIVSFHDVRVEVRKLSVGPMDNNVYLVRDADSVQALLIDAATDADRILQEVEGLELVGILTTHGHQDHWQALDEVADATRAPVYLHPADQERVSRKADAEAADGRRIRIGAAQVTLVHTPGHTPGSVCAMFGEDRRGGDPPVHLFSGDTLFPGGPGNTFGNADAFAEIMESLRERLFALPDATWVYPGHGDDTTIGTERPHLDEWQARGW